MMPRPPRQGQFRRLKKRVIRVENIRLADTVSQARGGHHFHQIFLNAADNERYIPIVQQRPEVPKNCHGGAAHRSQSLHSQHHDARLRREHFLEFIFQVLDCGEIQIPFNIHQHDGRGIGFLERNFLEPPLVRAEPIASGLACRLLAKEERAT